MKRPLYVVIFLLVFAVLVAIRTIDKNLTCHALTDIFTTYEHAFEKGNEYIANGEIRESLNLHLWQSSKARHCYVLAIESYEQALTLETHHTDALSNQATGYMRLGEYNQAIENYLTILEMQPLEQHARLGIAQAYEESGQLSLAILKYEEAIAFMEDSEYWNELYPDRIEAYQDKLQRLIDTQK